MNDLYFANKELNMQVLNPGASRDAIESVVPHDFKGKEEFIQFYRMHDGVWFPDGATISEGPPEEREPYGLEVEVIFRLETLITMREAIAERSMATKKFLETHIPFAGDAGGNEFYIEIPTGVIKYLAVEYDIEEGLSEVASGFREFCMAIKPLD
jgi:hypothetical protein